MSTLWKVVIALALVLPLGAFVAGSLVASAADDPAPRETIIVEDPGGTPGPRPTNGPTDPGSSSSPDDELEGVTPSYGDIDDDDDDSHRGRGGGEDDDDRDGGGDDHDDGGGDD